MKNFNHFVTETEIKLRRTPPSVGPKPTDNFIDDLVSTTQEHPFNHRVRIVNGNVGVHVSPTSEGSMHIHDIMSYDPKSGAGTKALEHLKSLADKHNVPLEGIASGYTSEGGRIGSSKQLKKWYTKHGFTASDGSEDDGYDIHYQPKRKD
jgi:hypothetical protein